MPGCYSCPNVLRIIVCHNPGHQKASLLNLEMNVMKYHFGNSSRNKIIPSVWDARQILRVELRSGWGCSLSRCSPLEVNRTVVHHLEISENWRAVRCMFFFSACPVSLLFLSHLPFSHHHSFNWKLQSPQVCWHNYNYRFFPIVLQFCQHDLSQFK